jgi:hypothetical protein
MTHYELSRQGIQPNQSATCGVASCRRSPLMRPTPALSARSQPASASRPLQAGPGLRFAGGSARVTTAVRRGEPEVRFEGAKDLPSPAPTRLQTIAVSANPRKADGVPQSYGTRPVPLNVARYRRLSLRSSPGSSCGLRASTPVAAGFLTFTANWPRAVKCALLNTFEKK